MARECKQCGGSIPWRVVIEGKLHHLRGRKFCLTCSPFGSGNCKDLTVSEEEREKRRQESHKKKTARYREKYPHAVRNTQRKMREERKLKLVALLGGKCKRCGYDECPRCLQFHHRDRANKTFSVGVKGLLSKWEVLVEEARKCDLLCPTCHCELHLLEHKERQDTEGD